ncbi:hypothetical protein XENTR_v10003109 [Xenopus tropicalis]|nr:hypothetical protein XENTR_v10003109 [Xenopus tropicalis]
MATNLDEMLAQIRAEAERRGDDWLRQFLPSHEEQTPPTPTRRTRRSRPPTRLSPSPPARRRRPSPPSPQPSTSRGTERSRAARSKGSNPPTKQRNPDTPTGRPRGGGMAIRTRSGGPDAHGDDVIDAMSGASGTTTRLRSQASTGSREGGSTTRARQTEAPGPRGGRRAAARGRHEVGGEARAQGAAPGGGGEPAAARARGTIAGPGAGPINVGDGPERHQSWAQGATREGAAETAQAAWTAAHTGAGTSGCQPGTGGPATSVAEAQDMPTTAQATGAPTGPGAGPTWHPWGESGPPTTTQGGGALAGSHGHRPPQPHVHQAGPTGGGQMNQPGWAPAHTGETNRVALMGTAAGREGTTAAHSVAAQGMPPPLCLQQVQGQDNGGSRTSQQQGTTPGTGQDSTTSNYNSGAVGQVPGASAGSGSGGRTVPRPRMDTGAAGMMEWVRRSVAPKTWKDYNRIWEEWFQLERELGGAETGTERLGLLAWQLSRDFETNVSISVVERKLAGLGIFI